MSSSPSREPLSGTIRQDQKVVGAICLPEEDVQDFIEQFNRCYGPMGMHIDMPSHLQPRPGVLLPVGASARSPILPNWREHRADAGNSTGL